MKRADDLLLNQESDLRLLLASNREPFKLVRDRDGDISECVRSMGGLTSALCPVLQRRDGIWICWDPRPTGANSTHDVHEENGDSVPFPLVQISMQESEVQGYYNGFCNRVLWPLCHTRLRCVTPRLDYWQQYSAVNERFADTIADQSLPSDIVWIHDYHLMLVPAAMRKRCGSTQCIGYFHHIPFPTVEVLHALPWHRQLLKGVLGANAVGFHTSDYACNFIESCSELLGCDTTSEPGTIIHGKHKTLVRSRPIGIDTTVFTDLAESAAVRQRAGEIRKEIPCERLVISADRLDYTKGLVERIEGIRAFFSRLPQCRGVVTFKQIAVPTRTDIPEYQQYRARLEEAVHSLNREFGSGEWQPLIYSCESVSRRELVAHYLAADIACVTPVADGLNLVAMEYCASRVDDDGVLILSRQAGAWSLLGEYALGVDVDDSESFLTAMVQALTMSEPLRKYRMTQLRQIALENTTGRWLKKCLKDIVQPLSNRPSASDSTRSSGNGHAKSSNTAEEESATPVEAPAIAGTAASKLHGSASRH